MKVQRRFQEKINMRPTISQKDLKTMPRGYKGDSKMVPRIDQKYVNVCVFIPSSVREGSTLLGDHRGSILSNRAETSQ